MKISLSKHTTHNYVPKEVSTVEELARLITSGQNWSSGVFENGHRKLANFMEADTIALDIDDGMSIKDAMETFKDYKHIIAPTENHQKAKNDGKVADRYRVVLFLDEKITNAQDYKATWAKLREQFPFVDEACSDASRYWKPSTKSVQASTTGKLIEKHTYVAPVKEVNELDLFLGDEKGKLSSDSLFFILRGESGLNGLNWNKRLTKTVIDLKEQLYSQEDAISMLQSSNIQLDDADLRCVTSVFEQHEVKYEPRLEKSTDSFNLQTIGEVYKSDKKVEWQVHKMLQKGGLSIIGGDPKAGKSTIIRQLVKNSVSGETFLGRETTKSKVLYLALEEEEGMFKDQCKQVGISPDSEIYTHFGPMENFDKRYDNLESVIEAKGINFVVVDTMSLFCSIQSLNDYNDVNRELVRLRSIARKTGAHILVIHHISKGFQGGKGTLLGSQAISGAVDNIIELHRKGKERFLTTRGRGCMGLYNHPLEFDWDTQSYTLGVVEDEF